MSYGRVKKSQLAKLVGVHATTITNWEEASKIEKGIDGLFDADEILGKIESGEIKKRAPNGSRKKKTTKAKEPEAEDLEYPEGEDKLVSFNAIKELLKEKTTKYIEADSFAMSALILEILDDIDRIET